MMKLILIGTVMMTSVSAFAITAAGGNDCSTVPSCGGKTETECVAPCCSWSAATASGIPGSCSTGGAIRVKTPPRILDSAKKIQVQGL